MDYWDSKLEDLSRELAEKKRRLIGQEHRRERNILYAFFPLPAALIICYLVFTSIHEEVGEGVWLILGLMWLLRIPIISLIVLGVAYLTVILLREAALAKEEIAYLKSTIEFIENEVIEINKRKFRS